MASYIRQLHNDLLHLDHGKAIGYISVNMTQHHSRYELPQKHRASLKKVVEGRGDPNIILKDTQACSYS